jgi:hypothetical protein
MSNVDGRNTREILMIWAAGLSDADLITELGRNFKADSDTVTSEEAEAIIHEATRRSSMSYRAARHLRNGSDMIE